MTEEGSVGEVYVDLTFSLKGSTVPLDHGYSLYGAVTRLIPALHGELSWGIHPIRGLRTAPGVLALDRSSMLKLRMPASEIARALPLAGATLGLNGERIVVGVPKVLPLRPSSSLKARFVTVKGFHDDTDAFREALHRQLRKLGIDGGILTVQDRRVLRVRDKTVVGYAVALTELGDDASMRLQIRGVGGRRKMGAGIFVPPGRRT